VFLEYGDDSVAQLGGVHLACEQASNVLTKVLEWGRLMAYLEQSTRYIPYDARLGGRYRFYRPSEVLDSPLALRYVADMLGMAYIRVYEIVTFYTMFNLAPIGRHYVQVCGTTPCMLRGSEDIMATCRKRIGPKDTVSKDGLFSWTEVECLGACVNAPMAQINKYYYEDLTPEILEHILDELKAGREVPPGPRGLGGRPQRLSAVPTRSPIRRSSANDPSGPRAGIRRHHHHRCHATAARQKQKPRSR